MHSIYPPIVLLIVMTVACAAQTVPTVPRPSEKEVTAQQPHEESGGPSIDAIMNSDPALESQGWNRTAKPQSQGRRSNARLRMLDVDVTLRGRIAETTLTWVVENPTASATEEQFAIELPRSAAVTRLAMDVEGVMTEGELLPQTRASGIYTEIVSSLRDPALLMWEGEGRAVLKVFPVPARGRKTLTLVWSEPLPVYEGERVEYTVHPPRLLPQVGHPPFEEVRASFLGEAPLTVEEHGGLTAVTTTERSIELGGSHWIPSGALTVTTSAPPPDTQIAWHMDGTSTAATFAVDVAPTLPAPAPVGSVDLVFALDRSASLSPQQLSQARAVVEEVAARLDPGRSVWIAVGHHNASLCPGGAVPAAQVAQALSDCLDPVQPGGGSNLSKLLQMAHQATSKAGVEMVLLSDGRPSLGLRSLRRWLPLLPDQRPIHTVALGDDPDRALLAAI
ncbi:MAG: VIT domain-containing protein, partial [Myxococcota bacterium]